MLNQQRQQIADPQRADLHRINNYPIFTFSKNAQGKKRNSQLLMSLLPQCALMFRAVPITRSGCLLQVSWCLWLTVLYPSQWQLYMQNIIIFSSLPGLRMIFTVDSEKNLVHTNQLDSDNFFFFFFNDN